MQTDNKPLVSIVTPTFNRREFLPLTLASVRLQTYSNVEHIVMDGGSTDGSLEILNRARSQWGVRVWSEADEGMYDALNKGFRRASGSIVCWLNSDDWLVPWAVESAVQLIQQSGGVVFGDVLTAEWGEQRAHLQISPQFNRALLRDVGTLFQPTVFFERRILAQVGQLNFEDFPQLADCDYWLRMSTSEQFVKCREVLAITFDHEDAKRRSLSEQITRDFAKLRATYSSRVRSKTVQRLRWSVRVRREYLALLRGRGWYQTRRSQLTDLSKPDWSIAGAGVASSPLSRHPLIHSRIGFSAYYDRVVAAARELSSEGLPGCGPKSTP